jgi:hypothetical protein
MNASALAAAAMPPPLPSPALLAGQAGFASLTRVSLVTLTGRLHLTLRFGEPARIVRLDRWRRVAVFLPGAVFGRIRWQANAFGAARWQLLVMQAGPLLDDVRRIPGVHPGARLLVRAEGEVAVRVMLAQLDAIERRGGALPAVPPAYWRVLGDRLASRQPRLADVVAPRADRQTKRGRP